MPIETADFSIKGMHCESCTKTLSRAIGSVSGVKEANIELSTGKASVKYDSETANMEKIFSAVEKSGYAPVTAENAQAQKTMPSKDIFSHLLFDKTRFHMERGMIKIALATFLSLAAIETLAYYAFFSGVPRFVSRNYGAYIFYLMLAVTLNGSALWHLRAYHRRISCQTGMMIGMTIGMLSGFLLGAIIGATNGMFAGATYGMLVGMAFGAYSGRCCGIMGIMEGLLAGLMGGLMGAMTTFMLINENVLLFMPLLFGSTAVILVGLTYMIYKDYNHGLAGTDGWPKLESYSFSLFLTFAFIITMATTWLIVYGPRSVLYQ